VLAHTSRALQGACPSPRPLLCCRCRKTIILHGLRADAAIAPGTAGTSPARTRHAVAATEAITVPDELGFPTVAVGSPPTCSTKCGSEFFRSGTTTLYEATQAVQAKFKSMP